MRRPSGLKVNVCLSLDPDVAAKLKEESRKTEVPMARLVNRALRKMYRLNGFESFEPNPAA